jgi:GDP-D-mannose 3',5'-epimerase
MKSKKKTTKKVSKKAKKALVIGAGGFIGHNLTKRLKKEGWWIKGVDLKHPVYEPTHAHVFVIADASKEHIIDQFYDRIYQLAADMGGAEFIFTGDHDHLIMGGSAGVNINILNQIREVGCGSVFYSSSVCVYPDAVKGVEADAWPANPPSNYGVEKLFSENLYLAHKRNHDINVKVARFHNCFGPYGTYENMRAKAPAAICRKVLDANDEIEIIGTGKQLRPFIYIEDLLDGIEALHQSDFHGPVNLGPDKNGGITIDELVDIVSEIAGKKLKKKYVSGPTGGMHRYANNDLAQKKLKWKPKRPLKKSLRETYEWIKSHRQSLSK